MPTPRVAVSLSAALLLSLVFSASSVRAQTTVTSERPATFTLPNGLQVVVIPDRRTPVVTHMLWYKVGSADETPGKSGLAHFLEHLMFKGTDKHPAGEFSKTVLRVGGNENAFTSTDYTGYFQRVPREQLAKMMEFEADRMTGLVFSAGTLSMKFGAGIAGALTGWLLTAFGYVPNVAQSGEALHGIRLLISVFPAIAAAAAMVVVFFYPLTGHTTTEMERALLHIRKEGSA